MSRPQLTTEIVKALAATVPWRAFGVWVYLHSRADRATGESWPTGSTIARDLKIDRANVIRDIRQLETAGWLQVTRKPGTRSLYRVRVPQIAVRETTTVATGGVGETTREPVGETTRGVLAKQHQEPNTTKNTTNKKRTKTSNEDPSTTPLPFQSERFRQTWEDFCEHRKRTKHPLTELATKRILAKLQRWGEPAAIQALDTSIENDWRGVFVPKGNGRGQPEYTVPKKPPYVFSAEE